MELVQDMLCILQSKHLYGCGLTHFSGTELNEIVFNTSLSHSSFDQSSPEIWSVHFEPKTTNLPGPTGLKWVSVAKAKFG